MEKEEKSDGNAPNFYYTRADRIFFATLSPREFRRATEAGSIKEKGHGYTYLW